MAQRGREARVAAGIAAFDVVELHLGLVRYADQRGHPMLDEYKRVLALDAALPGSLQGFPYLTPDRAAPAPAPADEPRVRRVYEGLSPWLVAPGLPFADALTVADDLWQWELAAPHIEVIQVGDPLPPNGALWRRTMTKRTDLGLPLQSKLLTTETIEVVAEGFDTAEGAGYRRYGHRLVGTQPTSPVLVLERDDGWIEMSGTRSSTRLKLYKRIVVSLPHSFEAKYGGSLGLGLSALLRWWAMGFVDAAGGKSSSADIPRVPVPQESKCVCSSGSSNTADPERPKVAVLGGGPAGLACAWLLSNPVNPETETPAWTATRPMRLQVTLVEKGERFGGKAASLVENKPLAGDRRIVEHGLHVALGFYDNLHALLRWSGANGLPAVDTTLVPQVAGADPNDAWRLQMKAWPRRLLAARSLWGTLGGVGPDSPLATLGFSVDLYTLYQKAFGFSRKLLDSFFEPGALDRDEGDTRQGMADVFAKEIIPRLDSDDPTKVAETRVLVRLLLLLRDNTGPRPLTRAALALWEKTAALGNKVGLVAGLDPGFASLQSLLRSVIVADVLRSADEAFNRLLGALDLAPSDGLRHGTDVAAPMKLLRERARQALPPDHPDAEVRMTSELIELATTIVVGLDDAKLVPDWCIDDPNQFDHASRYAGWVRAVQQLDRCTLARWLDASGVADGFVQRSRILDALTAGLFTTPCRIAAGTCVNGFGRLVLTYGDAPYYMLPGGTQEAVIDPLLRAMTAKGGVDPLTCNAVESLEVEDNRVVAAHLEKACDRDGTALRADAFVLAVPPFDSPLPGLPAQLSDSLASIHHRATVALQNWTEGETVQSRVVISGLSAPMRCAAPMNHLASEGPSYPKPPVYYCGDIDDEEAALWHDRAVAEAWLDRHAPAFQHGARCTEPVVKVNDKDSARYVMADPSTQQERRYVHQTGIENLWLAGDWTRSALSCGSIEAAITSGLEAARDILVKLDPDVDFHFSIVGAIGDDAA